MDDTVKGKSSIQKILLAVDCGSVGDWKNSFTILHTHSPVSLIFAEVVQNHLKSTITHKEDIYS